MQRNRLELACDLWCGVVCCGVLGRGGVWYGVAGRGEAWGGLLGVLGTWSGVLGAWPGVLEAVGAWSDVMGHGQIVWRGVVCCGVKRGRGAWWGVVGRAVACCGVLWRAVAWYATGLRDRWGLCGGMVRGYGRTVCLVDHGILREDISILYCK